MAKLDLAVLLYKPDELFFKALSRIYKQEIVPDNIFLIITECADYDAQSLKNDLISRKLFSERIIIHAVSKNEFNHGNTRRLAADMSEADYLLFMTQDAVPSNTQLISNMLEGFKQGENVAVCYARQLAAKDAKIIEKFSRIFNYPPKSELKTKADLTTKGIKAIFCSDTCAMYDLKVYRELGGFEKNVDFNEDELYAYKAEMNDYAVYYAADAKVIHSHDFTLTEHFHRSVEIAKSQKQNQKVFAAISSESEGIKYAKAGIKYILKKGSIFDLFYFITYCGVRYLGFFKGKHLKKR